MVFISDRNARSSTRCNKCPLRRLPLFQNGTAAEISFIQQFKVGEITLDSGAAIYHEDAESPHLFTILDGWAFRFKGLPDGRRQIVNFALRGDFIGLQNSLHRNMQHGVEALTAVTLCVFSRDRLFELFERQPGLALDVTWLSSREEQWLDDNLLAVGRRTALERTAYLLWSLFVRAREAGLSKDSDLELPMSQQHLADALGMSLVHTNKTLKRLRGTGAIEFNGRSLSIPDLPRLQALAKAEGHRPIAKPLI